MNYNNYNDVECVTFLPLAITAMEKGKGCVAGLDQQGRWIRPKPVSAVQIRQGTSGFQYSHWSRITLGAASGEQPENRHLVGSAILATPIGHKEWLSFITPHLDPDVESIFQSGRTAGLIKAQIQQIYLRRHIGNHYYLRMVFADNTGETFDWIIPDYGIQSYLMPHIRDHKLDQSLMQNLIKKIGHMVFLAIGLTLANDRFPGRYNGCQPLVVGLHSLPDYREK